MTTYLLLASVAGNFANHLKKQLKNSGKDIKNLKTIFITTAANTYSEKPWMEKDIESFVKAGFSVERMDIASLSEREIKSKLLETEVCIVGGGNTVYLLEEMLKKKIIKVIKKRVVEGMIYVGSSAGSVIAAPDLNLETNFDDRKNPPKLDSYEALHLTDFHILPHWGSEETKKRNRMKFPFCYEQKSTLLTLRDEQAVEINDGKFRIVSV